MPPRRKPHESSPRLTHSPFLTRHSHRLRNRMVGAGSGSRGKAASVISSSEHLRLRASWTQGDVEVLLSYVEDNRSKAGDRMVFQEGHFNSLLPLLPEQANGHRKTAKNCYDKWESLKREYYAASAVAGGSGLAYSTEKGANIVTEAGQLVMDELIETRLEAAQFRSKGFKYLEHMQRFVPADKARGTNAHHATGARNPSTFPVLPIVPPHPAAVQPAMQIHPSQYHPMAVQPPSQLTFVPYQPGTPGQVAVMQTAQDVRPVVTSQFNPAIPVVSRMTPSTVSRIALPPPANSSPSSIPVSPPSSTMTSLSMSLNPSSSISSRGQKRKTDATAGLDGQSTVASSVVTSGTGSSRKRRAQAPLQNTMQSFVEDMKDSTDKTLAAIGNDQRRQELNEAFALIASLEKNLSEANSVHLQMLLEEKPSFVAGYKNATTKSTTYRMLWVKLRLEAIGCKVPEYECLEGGQ